MNLSEASFLIEESIRGLKVDPVACRDVNPGKWSLRIKNATVWIDVFDFPATNPGIFYVQVMSPLFAVPATNKEQIAHELLEVSFDMCNCGIVKKGEWYYVLSYRPAKGLNQEEIDYIIDKVGFYSDDFYSKITYKYQGSWPPAGSNSGERPKD